MKPLASKDNNQFKIDFDFPGLCALCHSEVAEFMGSHSNGRPIIKAFKGNMCQMKVKLNDGSDMIVILCNKCFHDFQPEDMKYLMESVISGWQSETDILPWEEDKKLDHMTRYSKLEAWDRADFPMSHDDKKRIRNPDLRKLKLKVRD